MKNLTCKLAICALMAFAAAGCGDKETDNTTGRRYLLLNTDSKVVDNSAGSFDIYVSSSISWSVSTEESWLHPGTAGGTGNMTITISYDKSDAGSRSGVVSFSAEGVKTAELTVTQTERTFTNPVFQMADPWIVKHGDTYYTCKAQGNGLNISKSNKLSVITGTKSVWAAPADNATTGSKPWNVSNIWAPELHRVDNRWYIYYAAGRPTSESNGSYNKQRTGVLRALTDDPMGAWEDLGMLYTGNNYSEGIVPTTDNTIYAIDMGVFKLDGQLYAVWSGNASESDGSQRLFIATMSNPYTISSSRVEISRADQTWEKYNSTINEGPAFLHNEEAGKFFVVYSCNGSWTKQYRLGYIMLDTSKDPMIKSNWTKSPSDVFYRNDNTSDRDGVNGVGHNCFTKSPDGTEDWIVYHVKSRSTDGWDGRYTFIQKIGWNSDGTPNLGTPVAWGAKVPVPSGEPE